MAVFSVNQNRQLYVANAYKATVAGTDPAGTISVKADKAKKCFYFPYVGVDNLMRSDLIDVDKVMYAKATDADALAMKLKSVLVTLDSTVNGGEPISGQDYILRIAFRQYFGNSDGNMYFKHGAVHGFAGMTASVFYAKMAQSLALNFSRERVKPLAIHLVSGELAGGGTDEGEVLPTSVIAKKQSDTSDFNPFTTTYTGILIEEVEQDWVLGTKKQVPVYFDVYPSTVISGGDEVIWGTAEEVASKGSIDNGHNIADLEYFCMGERGDQYRNVGWPNVIKTKYLVDPEKKYNTIDIHYAYVGDGVSVQKSEKDITIVVPKVGANNQASNKLTNEIIAAINTATGLNIATLDNSAG